MRLKKYLNEIKLVKGGIYRANKSGKPVEVQVISVENHMDKAIVKAELIYDPKGAIKKEIGSIIKIDMGNFGRSFKKVKTPSILEKKYITESVRKFKKGQEVKVSATRMPIYSTSYKSATLKDTKMTLIVKEPTTFNKDVYVVVLKGKKKNVGGVKVPYYAQLSVTDKTGGWVSSDKARWQVIFEN